MNLNELKKMRQEKMDEITDIVETRGAEMTEDSLTVVKDIKSEIAGIDIKIEGLNELRSLAIAGAKPVEVKAEIAVNVLMGTSEYVFLS